MTVDLAKLKGLLEVLAEKNVAEFEHEDETVRFRIVRHTGREPVVVAGPPLTHASMQAPPAPASLPPTGDGDLVDVTSPFVGTFYRAPSPDAPPFVDVGTRVKVGQTLCIVEAMKLMNELEAEVSGTVMEVLVPNGKMVEFGQKLFRIRRA